MNIVLSFLIVLEVVVALLLILIILIQRSKAGGGLGGLATTSAGVEEAFGASAGNVLTKATVWLLVIFLVNTLGIGVLQGYVQRTLQVDKTLEAPVDSKKLEQDKPKPGPALMPPSPAKPEPGKKPGKPEAAEKEGKPDPGRKSPKSTD